MERRLIFYTSTYIIILLQRKSKRYQRQCVRAKRTPFPAGPPLAKKPEPPTWLDKTFVFPPMRKVRISLLVFAGNNNNVRITYIGSPHQYYSITLVNYVCIIFIFMVHAKKTHKASLGLLRTTKLDRLRQTRAYICR